MKYKPRVTKRDTCYTPYRFLPLSLDSGLEEKRWSRSYTAVDDGATAAVEEEEEEEEAAAAMAATGYTCSMNCWPRGGVESSGYGQCQCTQPRTLIQTLTLTQTLTSASICALKVRRGGLHFITPEIVWGGRADM